MKPSILDITIWPAILILIFGVLFGLIENNFTAWFCFVFLCFVGLLRAAWNWNLRK